MTETETRETEEFNRIFDVEVSEQDVAEGPEVAVAEAIAEERAAEIGEVALAVAEETAPAPAGLPATQLAEILELADLATMTGFYPNQNRIQLAQKAMHGAALGLSPAVAFQSIISIRNTLSLSAELQRALLKRAGYTIRQIQSNAQICELELLYRGEPVGSCSFTIDEAKQAGLMRSDAWRNYAADMLWARATTRLVARFAPEILFWAQAPPLS